MQNLIVFCQRCFTWIEPHSEMCPECAAEVILDQPDLDLNTVAEAIGQSVSVIGLVRVDRLDLPSCGYLVTTTEGLLFLPRLHRRLNGAWEEVTTQRAPGWWPFRGEPASAGFLNWLRRPFGSTADDAAKQESRSEQPSESLAGRLIDSPGGFFIEFRSIRSITSRRRKVRIDRSPLRSVTLLDETDDGSLGTSLNAVTSHAAPEPR